MRRPIASTLGAFALVGLTTTAGATEPPKGPQPEAWAQGNRSATESRGIPVHIDAGISASFAPRIVFRGERYSGAHGSLVGTLSVGHAVGQIQFDRAAVSTFRGPDASRLLGATSVVGSAGYRLGDLEGVAVDLLATGGVAWIGYEANNNDWADVSPQLGITLSPRVVLIERLVLSCSVRHLVGWDVDPWNSRAIGRTDVGLAVQLRIF
ncbi:MAG: hypothetical protein KTR31_25875 [Myxococcales bacterium]|nr:hypothetical protein [Myxococcales bacterium]